MSLFTCAVNTVHIVNADIIQGYVMIYVTHIVHIVQCAEVWPDKGGWVLMAGSESGFSHSRCNNKSGVLVLSTLTTAKMMMRTLVTSAMLRLMAWFT